jgi:iron complex outermembrane receptor protein
MKDVKTPQVEQRNTRGSEVNPIAKWMTATTHACLACALSIVLFSSALPDEEVEARSVTYQLNIPAENLDAALQALALASHHKLLYRTELVAGKTSRALIGTFTTEEAVRQLLSGTDLGFEITPASVVLIKPKDQGKSGDAAPGVGTPTATPTMSSPSSDGAPLGSDKSSRDRLRLAQATQGATSSNLSVGNPNSQPGSPGLSEIIVTAQKREERLQDVPVPVTAIEANTLVDRNQLRLQDYYSSVPGLSVSPSIEQQTTISIRGINTGFGVNPTVGITVDDLPYGASTQNGGGPVVPDIDPADLARIEVLRGPQGTLYGASTLGGLIKYVTVDPSTEAVSGRVEAGTDSVYNGSELGYSARGSVNVPLSDALAVRASGFAREDPGYIDNPILHIDGVNEVHVSGGRLAALWQPAQDFSLKVTALLQDSRGDGSSDIDVPTPNYPESTGLGDLQQNYPRGVGAFDRRVQVYGATLKATLGGIDLVAISGYSINSFNDSSDFTFIFGPYSKTLFGTPYTADTDNSRLNKFSQEVRLSSKIGDRVDWLLGGFYTYENSKYFFTAPALIPATGEEKGNWYYTSFPSTYQEEAAFTDWTFQILDPFDIQLGARESHIYQTNSESVIGPYAPFFLGVPSPAYYPQVDSSSNAFTYLVTPRFKFSPDLMVYARLASGYRPGGPNAVPGTPREFSPDKTNNYEIGLKGDFLDHTLSVDSSVYYIGWKNIQLLLLDPTNFQSYTGNASQAKSEGVELSVQSKPMKGLTIAAWVAWNEAELTRGFPPDSVAAGGTYGVAGNPLPYAARFSGYLSLEEEFPLVNGVTALIGGSESYVGDREGEFTSSPERTNLPAYARTDLRAAVKYSSWTLNVFANNVADKRGLIAGGLGYYPPFGFQYIQPRTVGVSIARAF